MMMWGEGSLFRACKGELQENGRSWDLSFIRYPGLKITRNSDSLEYEIDIAGWGNC